MLAFHFRERNGLLRFEGRKNVVEDCSWKIYRSSPEFNIDSYELNIDLQYLAISIYILKLVSALTNIIMTVVSRYPSNELSGCFIWILQFESGESVFSSVLKYSSVRVSID